MTCSCTPTHVLITAVFVTVITRHVNSSKVNLNYQRVHTVSVFVNFICMSAKKLVPFRSVFSEVCVQHQATVLIFWPSFSKCKINTVDKNHGTVNSEHSKTLTCRLMMTSSEIIRSTCILFLGYVDITTIPSGATNIKIRENGVPTNYIGKYIPPMHSSSVLRFPINIGSVYFVYLLQVNFRTSDNNLKNPASKHG